MISTRVSEPGLRIELADEAASERLAAGLAMLAGKGDLIALEGDLGAGKTTIARSFVRTLADNPALEVPSPTFTLVQTYELDGMSVAHMDFYRLEEPAEIDELGIDEALDTGAVIVEWPSRAADLLPPGGLLIELSEEDGGRSARLSSSNENWSARLGKLQHIDDLLAASGWQAATRHKMPADASSRRYERLSGGPGGASGLLMDMPSRPDGDPVRNGLPYSRIAHLAEDIRAVEAVNRGLLAQGLSAPEIHAIDTRNGFAVIEDFGAVSFRSLLDDSEQFPLCLTAAVMMLANLAQANWPERIELSSGDAYQLSHYDMDALLIEAELCLDWYWPHVSSKPVDDRARDEFMAAWHDVLQLVQTSQPVWVLRDFHVDNLFWLPQRDGDRKIGLIDTQDCVLGHPAYDLASLLQDVRVTIPAQVERDYYDMYVAARGADDESFDTGSFAAAYAILGAQRATKILGIFARLNARDGKPAYLRHLPRASDVLEHNLRHPALATVKAWFDEHLPRTLREDAGS
ncbi:tRNA (adenosine(37)-N6)-threonylcarbamoyltransferase complex ATPase subunit type 1 TsaE [Anderseniella sp. Alg231-50]|uniref:tRNA (adenosine(37)-N6)-threonylcarbamoyltransferase complex ATPase subunit type 1 TsaE n=1 Tax=Anderseniella sp. Alg231-50 TaxID=1922226 RepID=UPI00307C7D69